MHTHESQNDKQNTQSEKIIQAKAEGKSYNPFLGTNALPPENPFLKSGQRGSNPFLSSVIQQKADQNATNSSTIQLKKENEETLASIQGLPIYALLPKLESLPYEVRTDEEAAFVGGPRLVLAMRAIRAKRGEGFNALNFLIDNDQDLKKLPPDQFTIILSYINLATNSLAKDSSSSQNKTEIPAESKQETGKTSTSNEEKRENKDYSVEKSKTVFSNPPKDKWDDISQEIFNVENYEAFQSNILVPVDFFGTGAGKSMMVYPLLNDILAKAEINLKTKKGSDYKSPQKDSCLRLKAGMHGFGMAIDFDPTKNPYVAYESNEAELDKELLKSYDRIAKLMLKKPESAIRKLKSGRKAFNNSIENVYDVLKAESDAMKEYFNLMKQDDIDKIKKKFDDIIGENENGGNDEAKSTPDEKAKKILEGMKEDYMILGGKDSSGKSRTTKSGDRPFAPSSTGGKGDPSDGFLNVDKDFVLAMTEAGLAWGAIDISGEPGDIMHFDLRLTDLGGKVYSKLLAYRGKKY